MISQYMAKEQCFRGVNSSDSNESIISHFFHSSQQSLRHFDRGFCFNVAFFSCLLVISVHFLGEKPRGIAVLISIFSDTVSAFRFLSHLILIVFPLIVFTYTVMFFSSNSSIS